MPPKSVWKIVEYIKCDYEEWDGESSGCRPCPDPRSLIGGMPPPRRRSLVR